MEEQVITSKTFDFELTDEVFYLFSDLIYKASGIRLTYQKKNLLVSRLMKRLKSLGIESFYHYYQFIKKDHSEFIQMLNCIATNTTKFFREEYHFKFLQDICLPELINKRTLNVWSAGCSTGEEAYSIAISIYEVLSKLNGLRPEVTILGTDISTSAIEFAKRGIYEEEQLPGNLAPTYLKRYFLKGAGEYLGMIKVKDFIKEMVRFERLNLKDKFYPVMKDFDIIFCRNVMIYFSQEMKEYVLNQFYNHLSEGGYLFLGHSEALLNRKGFKPVYISVYKKSPL
jgi:chemotaxis protein methyltransferase CheR